MKNSLTLIVAKTFLGSSILYGLFVVCTYFTKAYLSSELVFGIKACLVVSIILSYLALDFLFNLGHNCQDEESDYLNPEDHEF